MMAGLQGSGKTTNAAKLAGLFKKQQQRRPLLVACDVYRPAAIEQLKVVGRQLDIPVFDMGQGDPVEIAKEGVIHARKNGYDMVFLDTAGRLHIDEALMDELKNIKAAVKPHEILLVVDAMTGQDAVNVAKTFDEALDISGVLMSKMDGDARGGAGPVGQGGHGQADHVHRHGRKAGQHRGVPSRPHGLPHPGHGRRADPHREGAAGRRPEAGRAGGQEDVGGKLTLTDFYEQLQQVKNMGSMEDMLGMIPGLDAKALSGAQLDGSAMRHTEAIIQSMTPKERDNPSIHQLQPQKAHRRGLRPQDRGGQQAPQAV